MSHDEFVERLKEFLKGMRKMAYGYLNSDYATGYISAISTVEGFVAELGLEEKV